MAVVVARAVSVATDVALARYVSLSASKLSVTLSLSFSLSFRRSPFYFTAMQSFELTITLFVHCCWLF